jgi:hypothetical protein
LLNHLAMSRDNTTLTALPSVEDAQTPVSARPFARPWQAEASHTPETALLHKQEVQQQKRALQLLCEASQDDSVVARMLQAMQDGHGKPGDIAIVLGLPVAEVYNAMKRLDRKIVRVRQQTQQTQLG